MISKLSSTVVRGFCLGAADIVPGVSGGTVALVFGIYEQLLDNIRRGARALGSLVRLDGSGFVAHLRSVEWSFLLPLLTGIGLALLALSAVIERLLHERPEEMAGLFLGLVLGSVVVAWRLLHATTVADVTAMAAVAAVTFVLLGLQSGPVPEPSLPMYFGAGAIAICAMILPGISGSFLLLMMGMYAAVLGAVHDRNLVVIAVFGLGATLGLALFSSALGYLLDHHHDPVLGALIGLMVGSIRVLWPWPNGVGIISEEAGESISGTTLDLPTSENWLWPTVLAVAAFVVVAAVGRLAPTIEQRVAETAEVTA